MEQSTAVEISCRSCGASLVVEAGLRTAQCPYCDSPSVVERPPSADRPEPAFVLGFVLDRERASAAVQRWLRSRSLFAHSGLRAASVEKTRGVYVPAWLYGAVAESEWSASIGENYQETETYTTTDSKGRTVVRTRTVTRTEWRALAGRHASYVVDVVVTASSGVRNDELEAIEPFDLRALRRYTPALLSGWMAEDPSLEREECRRMAHDESVERVGRALARFMPGDTHRDLRHRTALRDEVTDLVLLPVWVFAARYHPDKEPVRLLVNGQSGEVQGRVPLSGVKIALTVVAVLALVALVVAVVTGGAGLAALR